MDWPWQYNFPPFFTLQPNEDTKKKQLDAWCDLVLNYSKKKRIFQIDLIEANENELFFNKSIDRKCSTELIEAIFDQLVKKGRGEWCLPSNESSGKNLKQSPKKSGSSMNRKCYVLWFTFEEWANLIYDYVNRNGLRNSVCTIYELIESDEVKDEQFYNIEKGFFKKCIAILQQKKKAELFYLDQNSEEGVKFF